MEKEQIITEYTETDAPLLDDLEQDETKDTKETTEALNEEIKKFSRAGSTVSITIKEATPFSNGEDGGHI